MRSQTLSVRYVVDFADKGTKRLLADDRKVRSQVKQTGAQLAAASRQATSASERATRAAGRHSVAQGRVAGSGRRAAAAVASEGRAAAAAATGHGRVTVSAERTARSYDQVARAAKRAEVAQKRATVRARAQVGSRVRGGAAGVGLLGAFSGAAAVRRVGEEVGEAQKVAGQTEAALRSTSGAARVTAREVSNLAAVLARKSGVDDELIQSGANVLLTFTKIRNEAGRGNKVFDRANQAALDLSTRFGKDLNSSALMVGKALNDPVKGVTSLGRAGVQFTKQQKDQIKVLAESGDQLGAQQIVLKELETQVGGSADAYGKTLPGALGRANVAVGNLAEKYGNKLTPSVERAVNRGTRFIEQMERGRGSGGRFRRTVEGIADGVGGVIRPLARLTGGVVAFGAKHPNVAKLAGGVLAVGVAVKALKFAKALTGVDDLVKGLRKVARSRAGQTVADNVVSGVTGIPGRTRKALDGMRGLLRRLMGRAGTSGGSALASNVASSAGSNISGTMGKKRGSFARAGRTMGGVMGSSAGTSAAANTASSAVSGIGPSFDKRAGGFKKAGRGLGKTIGRGVGLGIIAGIVLLGPDIVRTIKDQFKGREFAFPWQRGTPLRNLVEGKRKGGSIPAFQTGGALAMLSSGEMGVEPSGRTWTVPGPRVAADNVLAHVPRDTKIFTDHGQGLMAQGASVDQALAHQLPHFATGGQVAGLAAKQGLRGKRLQTAVAVAGAESGWRENATNSNSNGSIDRGLWQINSVHGGLSTLNPLGNARAMSRISGKGSNWRPWVTFNKGLHQSWMGRAAAAMKGITSGAAATPGTTTRINLPSKLSFGAALPSPTGSFASGYQAGLGGTPLWDTEGVSGIASGAGASLQRRSLTIRNPAARTRRSGGGGGGGLRPGGGWGGTQNLVMGAIRGVGGRQTFKRSVAVNGNQASDHNTWNKNAFAADISPGSDSMFQKIRSRLGIPAVKGAWNKFPGKPPGFRTQLLWHAPDGSHKDHVHLGVKRLRRGGIVGGFRGGGRVGRALGGLTRLPTESPNVKGALRSFAGLIDTVDEISARIIRDQLQQVRARLRRLRRGGISRRERGGARELAREGRGLREQLAPGPSYGRLERIERNIAGRIRGLERGGVTRTERVGVRRLQAAQRLVVTELGRRVGLVVRGVEKQAEAIERGRSRLSRTLRTRGIDEASSAGVGALRRYTETVYAQLQRSRLNLEQALRRATRRRDRTAIQDLSERLVGIREELGETMATWIEQGRAQIEAAARERVDLASSLSTLAGLGLQQVELRQRLAGTYETGGAERAGYIQNTILPAIAGEFAALQGQLDAARQTGNAELARQIAEALAGKENERLQALLDIKEATESTAENTDLLKELTGSLGFEFGGQRFSDLISVGTGA